MTERKESIIKFGNDSDFDVVLRSHQAKENHRHDCLELVYVLNGTASHVLRKPDGSIENNTLVPGSYFFVDYNTYHAYHNGSDDFEIVNFLLLPTLIDRRLAPGTEFETMIRHPAIGFDVAMLSTTPVNRVFFDDDGYIRVAFEFARENAERVTTGQRELMRCFAIQILITALQRILKGNAVRHKNAAISEICDYVDAHYAEHITLTQICRDRYFSLPYVSRKFKQVMGVSFEQYLQQVRMHHASNLLVDTQLSIDMIAQSVGYSDTNSFRNVFRKTTDQTPNKFRATYMKP
jgi:AraC-like DNA-binding protein